MAPSDKRSNVNPALARNDLTLTETQTETEIAQTLRDRFVRDVVYTRIGPRVMVTINPGKPLASSNEATCAEYVEEYKNPTGEPLNPHVFQVASGAYLHLRRTGLDQAIVLQGETGSGKTENLKLILKYYDSLRSQSKKESKIFQQLLDAHAVLESFGAAKTFRNTQASRFGLYTEIQFSSRGRIIGAKLMDYHLEKSRLTQDHNGTSERNFSILYQLMAGCTVEERQRWRLKEASNYYYLGGTQRKALEISSDEPQMEDLRNSLKSIGIGKKQQSQIFRALAAIIHLGNVEFVDPEHITTQEAAYIKNDEQLVDAADMLGVHARALEGVLTYKQQLVNRDIVTIFLNATQAAKQRDLLARSLYGLLWSWLLEQMNDRLCSDNEQASFIGILDIVGFQSDAIRAGFRAANFDQFIFNSIAERINHFGLHQIFSVGNDDLIADGLNLADIEHIDNGSSLDLLLKPRTGLLAVMDRCSTEEDDEYLLSNMQKQHSENSLFLIPPARLRSFAIQHFAGQCIYDVQGFTTATNDSLSADFVTLFRGNGADLPGSVNAFITGLFESKSVVLESHARNAGVVVGAQQKNGPTRAPSMKKPKQAASEAAIAESEKKKRLRGVGNQVHTAIGELVDSLNETKPWFVFCLRPHETAGAGIDLKYLKTQVRYFQLSSITSRKISCRYTMSYTHQEFLDRFTVVIPFTGAGGIKDTQSKCHAAATVLNFNSDMCVVGRERVWLSEDAWRQLEQSLRTAENEARARRHGGEGVGDLSMIKSPFMLASVAGSVYGDEGQSYISDDEFNSNYQRMESVYDNESVRPTEDEDTDLKRGEAGAQEEENVAPAEEQLTRQRKQWVGCTWCLTWWVPTSLMATCGIKRPDVQMAWREKLALCIIIFLMCLFMLFFIVAFGPIVCPKQNVYTAFELQGHSDNLDAFTSIRGEVFDITNYTVHHGVTFKEIMQSNQFAGKDSSLQFPVQVSQLCDGVDGKGIDFSVSLQNYTKEGAEPAYNHDYRWYRFPDRANEHPDRYSTLMNQLRATIKKGYVGWDPAIILQQGRDQGKNLAIIHDQVFDLTDYNNGNIYSLFPGGSTGNRVNTKFLDSDLASLFSQLKGTDITPQFEAIFKKKSKALKRRMQVCLRNLFFVGLVDYRNSFRCRFSEFLLLFISAIMVSVIFFKFLASLQLTGRRTPQEFDKFVICNVPCYTEDEESLKRTIDSLTVLKYDDKRKLLFIVADGMIVGSGNDRPTPRIVLDILGVDPSVDPEPLAFHSLGDGMKQLNYAKVYTGLYECRGHVVPYLVVIKVGKPTERQRPGNRGKRDSQMLLMRFFNAVHYGKEMTPLELEIYHQMKNVIGVDPSFYEYVLMVDADTLVYPDSLNRMVSCLVHDAKIMGICGETTLMNAKATWITMMQVYEYYISHHMSKAFESLFGSVTCLPGCFSMYRLRTPDKGNPLLIHNHIIEDYSENKVDTLHKKNLLHLGEDRYLTTLMLKHFPTRKMTFTPDATCETNAPDSFKVLLSQRRRWINSTVHNLFELLLLDRLCGFCCFSMRFVVFLDLFGTIVMPATVCYLGYLLYKGFTSDSALIMVSLIMFAVVYGLQAIVFLVRRKWEHIGWMIVYILAIPYSGLFIPLYSFWHFDDFSWGNTRMVVGDKGDKKYAPADEEKFDPKCIPRKKWQDYEQEVLWETTSDSSKAARKKMGGSVAGSVYGGVAADYALPLSRPASNYTSISLNMPAPMSMEMTQISRSQTPVIGVGFPSDEQILTEIRRLLENADLMVVTKKQIREDLSRIFNMDMSPKKDYISQCIDMILHGGAP